MPEDEVFTVGEPEQLKALGHPLRAHALALLAESEEELTNRELAERLGVEAPRLHFHMRALLKAGLIALGTARDRREKPYRAVARYFRIAPEAMATRAAIDVRAAMLERAQRGWAAYGESGRFRATQVIVHIDLERLGPLVEAFVDEVDEHGDPGQEPIVLTILGHPPVPGEDTNPR